MSNINPLFFTNYTYPTGSTGGSTSSGNNGGWGGRGSTGGNGGSGGTVTIIAGAGGAGGAGTTLGGTGAGGHAYGWYAEKKLPKPYISKYKKGDKVETPLGAAEVFCIEEDVICVQFDTDELILYEFDENEIKGS